MVLYLCNIWQLEHSALSLLTSARQQRYAIYRQDADRRRCLGAGLLLRHLLGEDAEKICTGSHGKPYLPDSDLCFNLSHSGDYVVLAADTAQIGVDIEYQSPVRDGIAQRCYTAEERDWLARQQNTTEAFYRLWTGKESIMKATGQGLSMGAKAFSILEPVDGWHCIMGTEWYMRWHDLEKHSLCVSSVSGEGATIENLSFEVLTK